MPPTETSSGDLPVGGRGEGDPGEVSGGRLVPAADGELTVGLVAGEGEDTLVDLALVDEVLEGVGVLSMEMESKAGRGCRLAGLVAAPRPEASFTSA